MERWVWAQEGAAGPEVKEKEGVVYLSYPSFTRTGLVAHGFSTREGGVSGGIWRSMNLGCTRGDDPEAVMENFRRISRAIGFPLESVVSSDQTHTANVRRVGASDRGHGILRPKDFFEVDGMITDEPGVTLATFYADCVPLFFLDPVHQAIGMAHSGWRGTAARIGEATVQAMAREFDTRPEDLLAAIGPSICQRCYEVGEEVIREFRCAFRKEHWASLFYQKENGKYQLNLWRANELVLLESGIRPDNLTLPNLCTCCNPENLFSHRASQGRRGNLGAFLMLK